MKKILLLILIITFAAGIQGCTQPTEQPQTPAQPETTESTLPEETTEQVPPDENAVYVSLDGDDANPGTFSEPFKTFQKAVQMIEPGQTLYVLEGTYSEQLNITKSGTQTKTITVMAYPDHEVIIDGENLRIDNWDGLIRIYNQSYIRVSGFNVVNSNAMGIFANNSSNITIDNNYIYNMPGPGIHCWGDSHLVIENNTLESTCNAVDAPLECVSTRRTTAFQINNNHVFDSGAIGICLGEGYVDGKVYDNEVNDTKLGIYVGGWDQLGHDTEVYNNVCHHNKTGIAVNIENGGHTDNILLYNNIVYENTNDGFNVGWGGVFEATHTVSNITFDSNVSYSNGGCGFTIMGVHNGSVDNIMLVNNLSYNNYRSGIYINGTAKSPLSYSIKNISIINNTIYNNGNDNEWVTGGIYISNPDTDVSEMENIRIQNNIVSQNKTFSIAIWKHGMQPENLIIKNNLIDGYKNDVNKYGETRGTDYIMGNPQFADIENYDFHILGESPAIDAGTLDLAPQEDYDGTARPLGGRIDIGAYEYDSD